MFVMGYEYNETVYSRLYCLFKYPNGTKVCRESPVEAHLPSCFTPNYPAKPKRYYCSSEEPPVSVQLSTSSSCEPNNTGGEIPVNNYNHSTPEKKFGVCIQEPLRQESPNLLSDLIEYIEMSQLLGAELIVFYVHEHEVDRHVLEYIRTHYPDLVRLISWKKFEKWNPMHYYEQLLISNDCLYRVMYEVEYLISMDLDELLLPVKHDNWSALVGSFPSLGEQHSTLKFQSRFFDYSGDIQQTSNCPNMRFPRYLARTKKYLCHGGRSYIKYMSQPRLVYETAIHSSCNSVPGHAEVYEVPPEVALSAHYRPAIPKECIHVETVVDNVAKRFNDALTRRVCSHA